MSRVERRLDRLFGGIEAQRARDFGRRRNEIGSAAEKLAFDAAERLKDRGAIGDWRQHDPELDKNGVDLVITGVQRREYLLNIKSSDWALESYRRNQGGELPGWIIFVILPSGTTVEKAEEILLNGIEMMRKRYEGSA